MFRLVNIIALIFFSQVGFGQMIDEDEIQDLIQLYLEDQHTIVAAKLKNAKFVKSEDTPTYELRGIRYSNSYVYSLEENIVISKYGGTYSKTATVEELIPKDHSLSFETRDEGEQIYRIINVELWVKFDGAAYIDKIKSYLCSFNKVNVLKTGMGYVINNSAGFGEINSEKYSLSNTELISMDYGKMYGSITPFYLIQLKMKFIKAK